MGSWRDTKKLSKCTGNLRWIRNKNNLTITGWSRGRAGEKLRSWLFSGRTSKFERQHIGLGQKNGQEN